MCKRAATRLVPRGPAKQPRVAAVPAAKSADSASRALAICRRAPRRARFARGHPACIRPPPVSSRFRHRSTVAPCPGLSGLIAIAFGLVGLVPCRALADAALVGVDALRAPAAGPLSIDAGLLLAKPAALGPGLSTGFGVGVMGGRTLAWEARASWSTATESSISWTVTQSDLRLRVGAALQSTLGRARAGLRIGIGPTIVHETRTRNQGAAANLTGSALGSSSVATLPAGEVEAFVALHLFGPWLFTVSGGPSASIDSGNARAGWISMMGVGWQP